MRWIINKTDRVAEQMRFGLKCFFAVNLVFLAMFSVLFTAVFLFRLFQYLWKAWLGHPW